MIFHKTGIDECIFGRMKAPAWRWERQSLGAEAVEADGWKQLLDAVAAWCLFSNREEDARAVPGSYSYLGSESHFAVVGTGIGRLLW